MDLSDSKTMSSFEDDIKEVVVDGDKEEESRLPGFRFHPTDEELVSFYLKRKVQKRHISIEIIKQIDIYKHDPWELAKGSSVGEKEWYFYCKRERKYRNSVRPNRVTGSGFWKATGIDKPIYSNGGEGDRCDCVGLKKSLVYYTGSAGKGTKTHWMMHEFRLPTQQSPTANPTDTLQQQPEVWTLCRIFKRNRKYTPDWKELSSKISNVVTNSITSSKTCSTESFNNQERYISFENAENHQHLRPQNYESTNYRDIDVMISTNNETQRFREQLDTNNVTCLTSNITGPSMAHTSTISDTSNFSSPLNPSSSVDEQVGHFLAAYDGNWDDLSSVVEFATRAPFI